MQLNTSHVEKYWSRGITNKAQTIPHANYYQSCATQLKCTKIKRAALCRLSLTWSTLGFRFPSHRSPLAYLSCHLLLKPFFLQKVTVDTPGVPFVAGLPSDHISHSYRSLSQLTLPTRLQIATKRRPSDFLTF